MIEPRLASKVQVAAIRKQVEANGDFAMVLRKGDPVSGSILLIIRIRGEIPMIYERFPAIGDELPWQKSGPKTAENEAEITAWLKQRAERDPDIWLIELDIAEDKQLDGILASMG